MRAVEDRGTAIPTQLLTLQLLPRFEELLAQRVAELSVKAAAAQAVVAEVLPDWEVAPVRGGGALWATLPGPARAFAAHAARAGVLVVTDETFAAAEPPDRALRLPFTAPEEVFRRAIDRLAQAWATFDPDQGDRIGVAGLVV